jgi:hypothetical protein
MHASAQIHDGEGEPAEMKIELEGKEAANCGGLHQSDGVTTS